MPKPKRHAEIVDVIRECTEAAEADVRARGMDPLKGTANFDVAVLRMAHPRPTLAAALAEVGVLATWENYDGNRGYALRGGGRGFGFCGVWTAFCEEWAARLSARGVPTSVRYMMD